jgi:hypothetical protein
MLGGRIARRSLDQWFPNLQVNPVVAVRPVAACLRRGKRRQLYTVGSSTREPSTFPEESIRARRRRTSARRSSSSSVR